MPINGNVERRFFYTEIEFRADDAEPVISGYAAVFHAMSEDLGGFREVVLPGAFDEALKASDIRVLFNHDPSQIVARTKNGTLSVWEDDKGLRYEFTPNMKTQAGRDLVELVKRGDVDQSSFAFSMDGGIEEWDDSGDVPVRRIVKVGRLYDVSPVTYPAYPATEVQVARSVFDTLEEIRAKKEREEAERRAEIARKLKLKRLRAELNFIREVM